MRALVLTTQTPHHAYFVQRLSRDVSDLHVICETTGVTAQFETAHPFESERERFEAQRWFGGEVPRLPSLAATVDCANINDAQAVAQVRASQPDVTIVFGTRKLGAALIQVAGAHLLNLHGGDPEYYRGLDTHLWAIYHNDFANLITALHVVNERLDDGAIVGLRAIPLTRGMQLAQLRAANTECAVRLCRDAIRELHESGTIAARAQRQAGRYYSFMPAALKAVCVDKFQRHCATLT
jgi:methionyl-tRNA formyltransferase